MCSDWLLIINVYCLLFVFALFNSFILQKGLVYPFVFLIGFLPQTDGSVPNTLVIANCEIVKPRVAAAEHISQVS